MTDEIEQRDAWLRLVEGVRENRRVQIETPAVKKDIAGISDKDVFAIFKWLQRRYGLVVKYSNLRNPSDDQLYRKVTARLVCCGIGVTYPDAFQFDDQREWYLNCKTCGRTRAETRRDLLCTIALYVGSLVIRLNAGKRPVFPGVSSWDELKLTMTAEGILP